LKQNRNVAHYDQRMDSGTMHNDKYNDTMTSKTIAMTQFSHTCTWMFPKTDASMLIDIWKISVHVVCT